MTRYFGTTAELWMNLQSHYELEGAQDNNGKEINERLQLR
jgi:plasmid maintenance system antidote protein VapI